MASAHDEKPTGTLLPGRPAPALTVARPTLAMALPTAMLLVDYAARGKTTPGGWPQSAAREVPEDLLEAAQPLRAVLGHGSGLRTYLLLQLPPDHPGHRDWPALRAWLAELPDSELLGLVDAGVEGNLAYGDRYGYPLAEADKRALAEADAAGDRRLELRVRWVLDGWGVPDPGIAAETCTDPDWFRTILVDLLDAIVAAGFDEIWRHALPTLDASTSAIAAAPPGTQPPDWVARVSGLRPDPRWQPWFDAASTVVCVPSPLLGRHLTVFATETDGVETVWVGYEPSGTTPAAETSGRDESTSVDLGGLARLGRQVGALGDQTRLSILLTLAQSDRPTAQQIAGELRVHLSTVSRQLTQLENAGLITTTKDGTARRYDVDRMAIRKLCQALERALG